MKVKSDQKHNHGLEKLFCIGVDGRIDNDNLLHREVKDANGDTTLKKGKGAEHHLTFTKEPVIPIKGATGVRLGEEVASVLEEFNSVHSMKAVLLDNTLGGRPCNSSGKNSAEVAHHWLFTPSE